MIEEVPNVSAVSARLSGCRKSNFRRIEVAAGRLKIDEMTRKIAGFVAFNVL
jgi:hypothetical protein